MFRPLIVLSALLSAAPAMADEVYAGGSFHGVDTPFTLEAGERGRRQRRQVEPAGWRSLEREGQRAHVSSSFR